VRHGETICSGSVHKRDAVTHTLSEMQSFFAGAIRQPLAVADQPAVRGQTPEFIAGNSRLSPIAQLEVYREQFWMRHVDALAEDFVTIHQLVGHDGFNTLVERYLEAHPPTDFSLRDLGARLPAFLETQEAYREDRLLVDCARLEWAFVDAFDAPDLPPLDPTSIASIPEDAWPLARLSLHPSVQLVSLAHPTHEYRAAVRKGDDPARPPLRAAHVVVYRGPETLLYIEIESLAFELLQRLSRGETLGEACESIAAHAGDAGAAELEEKVGGWFQLWAASGWVSAVTL
jgi:hypothetical protein